MSLLHRDLRRRLDALEERPADAQRDLASMTRTEMWDELARLEAETAAAGELAVTADDLPALEAEARRRGLLQ